MLIRMDIHPPYYVETQEYSVIQMEFIRNFIQSRIQKSKKFEEKMLEFIKEDDLGEDIYLAKLKARKLLYKCLPLVWIRFTRFSRIDLGGWIRTFLLWIYFEQMWRNEFGC